MLARMKMLDLLFRHLILAVLVLLVVLNQRIAPLDVLFLGRLVSTHRRRILGYLRVVSPPFLASLPHSLEGKSSLIWCPWLLCYLPRQDLVGRRHYWLLFAD